MNKTAKIAKKRQFLRKELLLNILNGKRAIFEILYQVDEVIQ